MRIAFWILALGAGLAAAAEIGLRLNAASPQGELAAQLAAAVEAMTLPTELAPPGSPAPTDAAHERMPHPFLTWVEPADQVDYAETSAYYASPAAAANFDVLVLGGPVAEALTLAGKRALKSALEANAPRVRGAAPEAKLRVRFLGSSRFKQPQTLNALHFALSLGWEPDLVLHLGGYNDLMQALDNARAGSHPINPAVNEWRYLDRSEGSDREPVEYLLDAWRARDLARTELGRLHRFGLLHSALLSKRGTGRIERHRLAFAAALEQFDGLTDLEHPPSVIGPPLPTPRSDPTGSAGANEAFEHLDAIAQAWSTGIQSIDATCRTRGIPSLQLLPPYAPDRAERDGDYLRAGLGKLRDAAAELDAAGVALIDASELFDHTDTDWLSSGYSAPAQLNPNAARSLGKFVGRAAAELLEGDR